MLGRGKKEDIERGREDLGNALNVSYKIFKSLKGPKRVTMNRYLLIKILIIGILIELDEVPSKLES